MTVLGSFRQVPEAARAVDFIARINAEAELEVKSRLIDEKMIERCWLRARKLAGGGPAYWLLLVRLAETALLCAANYADGCEFEAAGDLLVTPREILVHGLDGGRPTAKNRHERLSEQFGLDGPERRYLMKRFSAGVCLEVTKPPLLPHMSQVLAGSGRISAGYLKLLADGQHRIADTLAFLAAWPISDSAELWRRLQAASPSEREFVASNLCRFDRQIFDQIGVSLQRSLADPHYRSPFLTAPAPGETRRQRSSAATAGVLAGSPA